MTSSATKSLAGKVALISGSSSGIGSAIAQELSRRGANIVVVYRSQAEKPGADKTLSLLDPGVSAIAIEADLSTLSGPAELINKAVSKFTAIDFLIHNAAFFPPTIATPLVDAADFDRTMNVNGRGMLLLTQAALKHLSKKNSRIINISSDNATDPIPGLSLYSASKAVVDSFTRSWAKELPREYGCTVNAVSPGPVNTEVIRNSDDAIKQVATKAAEPTPVAPRLAEPDEIAWVVATLCEEKAGWVNGQRIKVNGGLMLW